MPSYTFAIIAFEVIAIIIVLMLYVIEYRKDRRLHEQKELPLLDDLRKKNADLLHNAIEKSGEIVSQAQIESIKVIADTNVKTKQIEDEFRDALTRLRETIGQETTNQSNQAIEEFTKYLNDLKGQSNQTHDLIETATKQRVNEFLERFEQSLSDFLIQTQQKSLSAIELELQSARNLIETYKEQQIKIINENILSMLEKTLILVLAKKITLKDHIDLIYDSLEKAKIEKFIV